MNEIKHLAFVTLAALNFSTLHIQLSHAMDEEKEGTYQKTFRSLGEERLKSAQDDKFIESKGDKKRKQTADTPIEEGSETKKRKKEEIPPPQASESHDATAIQISSSFSLLSPTGESEPSIPLVTCGHEEVFRRFLNGVLVYKPEKSESDDERDDKIGVEVVKLPIRNLANPLNGTFDLSSCRGLMWDHDNSDNIGNYLSISTGYRKEVKPENANKVEVWITPRFLIEKELDTTAAHFKPIMDNWSLEKAPVGLFYNCGWSPLGDYEYLTNKNMVDLSTADLDEHIDYAKVCGNHHNWPGDDCWSSRIVIALRSFVVCVNRTEGDTLPDSLVTDG